MYDFLDLVSLKMATKMAAAGREGLSLSACMLILSSALPLKVAVCARNVVGVPCRLLYALNTCDCDDFYQICSSLGRDRL